MTRLCYPLISGCEDWLRSLPCLEDGGIMAMPKRKKRPVAFAGSGGDSQDCKGIRAVVMVRSQSVRVGVLLPGVMVSCRRRVDPRAGSGKNPVVQKPVARLCRLL
jgi:hypothetical protein